MSTRTNELRLPPLAAIQAFEAAAGFGSFEFASDQLCVTASAVGKRIATLEKLIGEPLFNRSARRLTLSVAGAKYLGQVRAALAALADVSLHHRPVQRPAHLRIAAPPTFSRQILISHLDDFAYRHPDVELDVLLAIPCLDLSPPDTDLKIRFGKAVYAGSTATPLLAEEVFPVCARSNLAGVKGLATPRDLARAALPARTLAAVVRRRWARLAGTDRRTASRRSRHVAGSGRQWARGRSRPPDPRADVGRCRNLRAAVRR